ncbi:MAG: glycoside hydrolase 43 family protein [Paenibacillus macerans]|uniref:glycoside hydrolase family 43 protein n=1 Tax=Paenibacillus macerans TaxID=44252 RepID=UPI00290D30BE|nr:glycoside hydrolase 43 family protein [Paenibacillus macerans]MDU7472056.1 glycoside hydrolase 43 family protein [Paenibacillus macerans]
MRINEIGRRGWAPDLGDGTYRNPIIFADYSDPDIIAVHDEFYMVSSSFNHMPGLPLLHSRDLVNWTIINHVVPSFDWPGYDRVQHGKGIWAPSLRYHDGKFWVFFSTPDEGIFMCQAADPFGKWTAPHLVRAAKGWIDPCPFWDEDGQAYLVHAFAFSRSGRKHLLQLFRMAPDGTRLLDEGRIIIDGTARHPTLEGPKMYKRGGYYYIFAPAGGVENGWQSVFRARAIDGPYEDKIVLHQGETDVNGPHQGGYVELESGESWFVHFQDKGAYGRIVHLQPMRWVDDWPVMGRVSPLGGEPDKNGGAGEEELADGGSGGCELDEGASVNGELSAGELDAGELGVGEVGEGELGECGLDECAPGECRSGASELGENKLHESGPGEPVERWSKPQTRAVLSGSVNPDIPQTSDDFRAATLGLQWQWQANPRAEWYELRPEAGRLRLYALPLPDGCERLYDAPPLLLQKFPAPSFSATTQLTLEHLAPTGRAGLVVFGRRAMALLVRPLEDGRFLLEQVASESGRPDDAIVAGVAVDTAGIVLQAVVQEPGNCRFRYSLDGGCRFMDIGESFIAEKGAWVGAKVGICAFEANRARRSSQASQAGWPSQASREGRPAAPSRTACSGLSSSSTPCADFKGFDIRVI